MGFLCLFSVHSYLNVPYQKFIIIMNFSPYVNFTDIQITETFKIGELDQQHRIVMKMINMLF